jgi:hypothetical protein
MKRHSRRASGSLELLEACDPVEPSALVSEGVEGALDEIGALITSRPPRAERRRSMGAQYRVLVVAAAMLAIGAGAATGAVVFGAHTGLFPTEDEEAVGGPGEALNPAAPDFLAASAQAARAGNDLAAGGGADMTEGHELFGYRSRRRTAPTI